MTKYTVHKVPVTFFPSNIYYRSDDDLLQMFNEVMAALEEETMTPEDLQKKLRWAWLRNYKLLAIAVGLLILANGLATAACYVETGKFLGAVMRNVFTVELGLFAFAACVTAIILVIHQFAD